MKNIFTFCLAAIAIMVVTTGCPGPGGEPHVTVYSDLTEISGTIESFDELPAGEYTLKLEVYDNLNEEDVTLAECPISAAGEFTLELPTTVSGRYLTSSRWVYEDIPDSATISNHFNITDSELCVYDSDDEYVGTLSYEGTDYVEESNIVSNIYFDGGLYYADDSSTMGGWYYVNEDEEYKVFIEVDMKKGWNWQYYMTNESYDTVSEEDTETETLTTTLPFEGNFFIYDYENRRRR